MLNFVCFSQNNWEKRKARKQQFMLHLSEREDVGKVLYIEPPLNFFRLLFFPFSETKTPELKVRWRRALCFKIEPLSGKLFVFTPVHFIPLSFHVQFIYSFNLFISLMIIKTKIRKMGFKNTVLWLYHPYDYCLLRWFKDRVVSCFDWAEEWSKYYRELSFKQRQNIAYLEERIIKGVDVVFTVSIRLLEKAKKFNPCAYQLLDGASSELFHKETPLPKDFTNIRRPIVGYTGTISERVDIELLKFISLKLPDVSIVLIGSVLVGRMVISPLKDIKNIYFLGVKPYEQLPAYIKNFDVCIVPYKIDRSTSASTKLFDYLAGGRPVVSSVFSDFEVFGDYIKTAKSKEEFLALIKEALAEEDSLELRNFRIRKAQENSWEIRASEIVERLNNFIEAKPLNYNKVCFALNRGQKINKILVIPSHYVDSKKMKVRLIEIAQNLSTRYEVYLLSWRTTLSGEFISRAISFVSDLFKRERLYKKNALTMVEFPILHRPLSFALKFNSYFLRRFLRRLRIDLVLSGSYFMFDLPGRRGFRYILDLADVPATGFDNPFDRFLHRQTKIEAKKADAVTAVSYGLVNYIDTNYQRQAHRIPNGAYIDKLRAVNQAAIAEIRHRYGLDNKWVIGYIGLIGQWVDIEFLVKVFRCIKEEITHAALLLVGGSPFLNRLRRDFSGKDIIITGVVEEDISNYFNLLDIAVLPHKKNFYQDLAFHIKLIEYSAARKIVVSTPLEEVRRLNFPNILLAKLDIAAWVEAIQKARGMSWSNDWDGLVEPYSWNNILNELCNIIESIK